MKKVLRYFSLAILILFMALAMLTFVAPRFGWRVDVVLSGSMEPEVKVGSVVITRPIDAVSISVGDIITFRSPLNGKFTTHRVISIENGSSLLFQTKGDANEDVDPFIVGEQSVIGRVCFDIAYLGYITQFIKSRLGLLLTLYLPGLILVLIEVINIWRLLAKEPAGYWE